MIMLLQYLLNKRPIVENNTGELIFFNKMSKIICEKTWADKKSKVNNFNNLTK